MAPRNLGWLWYFVALGTLSILATAVLIVYNQQQQLRPEHLIAARMLWREKGPKKYHLIYEIKTNTDSGQPQTDAYDVTVQGGVAVKVLMNGRPQRPEQLADYGMEKLFDLVNENLEIDQQPGQPRTFTRALFEPTTGALLWYVRRVMGSRRRVEIAFEKLE